MADKTPEPTRTGRRAFLAGLVSGAGVVTALAGAKPLAARPAAPRSAASAASGPILYRRTEEAERYYRTLYR